MVEIKIDRTTLPADGQKVKFMLYPDTWFEGVFVDGDDLFWVNEKEYYLSWIVLQWEPKE